MGDSVICCRLPSNSPLLAERWSLGVKIRSRSSRYALGEMCVIICNPDGFSSPAWSLRSRSMEAYMNSMFTWLYFGSSVHADVIVFSISCFHWSKSDNVAWESLGIWQIACIVLRTSPIALTGSLTSWWVCPNWEPPRPRLNWPSPTLFCTFCSLAWWETCISSKVLWSLVTSSSNVTCILFMASSNSAVRSSVLSEVTAHRDEIPLIRPPCFWSIFWTSRGSSLCVSGHWTWPACLLIVVKAWLENIMSFFKFYLAESEPM